MTSTASHLAAGPGDGGWAKGVGVADDAIVQAIASAHDGDVRAEPRTSGGPAVAVAISAADHAG